MSAAQALGDILAWPDGSGVAGSLALSVALGLPAYIRSARKSAARHVERLAQDARHHREQMEQRERHHRALKDQAERHQQEQLDRQEVATAAIQAHVTQQAAAIKAQVSAQANSETVPVTVNIEGGGAAMADAFKNNVRKRGGGM